MNQTTPRYRGTLAGLLYWPLLLAVAYVGPTAGSFGADDPTMTSYRETIQPFVESYCASCHAEGSRKGNVTFDEFASDAEAIGRRELWWSALKNVRAGLMPPAGQPRPNAEETRAFVDWVKFGVLKIDPADPDPGRVTLRRLNRVEYRNTIKDLMGIDYNTDEEFPADDTGYGFDTIGDVLSLSPLLLEKYMQAAETVVAKAVPIVSRVMPVEVYPGNQFRTRGTNASGLSFYEKATVSRTIQIGTPGARKLVLDLNVDGSFEFDPARARLVFKAGDRELLREEYGWQDNKNYHYEFEIDWPVGPHELSFDLEPLTPADQRVNNVLLRVIGIEVRGPLDPSKWVRPKEFDRFFHADDPGTPNGRKAYAREVLRRFTAKAYRRPVDDRTLDRLVGFAEEVYAEPGKSVEAGIARAMIAVLSSPRFVFRVEETLPADGDAHPLLDEYALASRLSYFLWSTMPDDTLMSLAAKGELRRDLPAQIKRMLADERVERMTRNFVGQWLQARDIETISVDARTVLARDDGVEKELASEQEAFRAFLAQREAETKKAAEARARGETPPPGTPQGNSPRRSGRFRKLFGPVRVEFDDPLRQAMRRETEMFFDAVVREDRSVLELLDSDFTFVNERLAKHYGIPDVKGDYMRRVSLPSGSVRGGILTQGTVLIVTSNPTRTSPVKRGLFVLDNILGTPAPPAPPSVPDLEQSEKTFKDREPTLREVLELHRQKPLCNACHSRMDPLGLGLENFNALGLFREKERGQPLDTGGTLLTGETFTDVRTLKKVLKEGHRADFYRCLAEKLLTYAIGRGVEASDAETIDRIVGRLERDGGKFSALLAGVIESSPFQKRRKSVKESEATAAPAQPGPRPGGTGTEGGAKP